MDFRGRVSSFHQHHVIRHCRLTPRLQSKRKVNGSTMLHSRHNTAMLSLCRNRLLRWQQQHPHMVCVCTRPPQGGRTYRRQLCWQAHNSIQCAKVSMLWQDAWCRPLTSRKALPDVAPCGLQRSSAAAARPSQSRNQIQSLHLEFVPVDRHSWMLRQVASSEPTPLLSSGRFGGSNRSMPTAPSCISKHTI